MPQGDEALPNVVSLTVACWVADFLDCKLVRQPTKTTYLGKFDPVTDWILAVPIALCLVLWQVIPWLSVVIVMGIVTFSTRLFHFVAPSKFFIGVTYGILLTSVCWEKIVWVLALVEV